jgi:hypothetical protein
VISPTAYLNEVVDAMRTFSVHRKEIDWSVFRESVLKAGASAQTIPETYAAIRMALGLLGDHHSSYTGADGTLIGNPSFPPCFVDFPPVVLNLPPDIGYVRVSASNGNSDATYAAALQAAVRGADTDAVRGWIVDLRGNGGGASYPMIAGIGPILGEGTAGYFISPESDPYPWGYDSRGSWGGPFHAVFVAVGAPYSLKRPNPRVAVLTSRWVASAGEAVAVAFRGRPNTRTFGTATCGVPTGNAGHILSDGANLVITGAYDADRNLVTYNDQLPPDEVIEDVSGLLQRAIEWLRSA